LNHLVNFLIPSAKLKPHYGLILSHRFIIPNREFDELILVHFGPIALCCLNKAMSNLEDTHRNDKQAFL
jgi:hypothetical protein